MTVNARLRVMLAVLLLVFLPFALAAVLPSLAQATGRFVGVGIAIQVEGDGSVWVEQVLPDGPAARAGIRSGDEILSIDGRSVADLAPGEVPRLIRGPEGSQVSLTVRSEGQRPRRLVITRAMISVSGPRETGAPTPSPSVPQASGEAAGPSPKAPSGSLKFTRVSIKDPGMNNIEAVSFLVPEGWQVKGGITWLPNYSILANLRLRIADPRSGAVIEFLPVQNFTWLTRMVVPMRPGTNYLGNILWRPIRDIPTFIRIFYLPRALRHLQGGRVVRVKPLPGVAVAVARATGASRAVAARVRYAYLQGGRPWEEDVFVTLTFTDWQMGTIWSVHSAYAFRAPAGQLDRLEPVMEATVSSQHLSLDWFAGYRYVQKLFQNRMNRSIADAGAISRTISRNSEEIRQMYADSYRKASESQDRINREFSEAIRGVETYRDPYKEQPVQLPSGYRDAWVNGNGEYILSNDANYNPNVGHTTGWRRMHAPK